MSTEDLENYEAERELQLAQEYQDVSGLFRYAVETERRFYLANEVNVRVVDEGARPLVEVELRGRVGVGHVPAQPVRALRAGADLQGRERRGAPEGRALSVAVRGSGVTAGRQATGRWGEAQVARWYQARGYDRAGPELAHP